MASERARPIPGAVFADHVASRLETKDLEATLATMAVESCVTRRPTLDGGVRTVEVRTFYDALIARATHRHSRAKKDPSRKQ